MYLPTLQKYIVVLLNFTVISQTALKFCTFIHTNIEVSVHFDIVDNRKRSMRVCNENALQVIKESGAHCK